MHIIKTHSCFESFRFNMALMHQYNMRHCIITTAFIVTVLMQLTTVIAVKTEMWTRDMHRDPLFDRTASISDSTMRIRNARVDDPIVRRHTDATIAQIVSNNAMRKPYLDPVDVVWDMIHRLFPQYNMTHYFDLQLVSASDSGEYFVVHNVTTGSAAPRVQLVGTSRIALASAFNYWLKYWAFSQVTWNGDQLHAAATAFNSSDAFLATIPTHAIMQKFQVKWRYYFSTTTFGYSAAWWNWTRWERELDWMALNGINLPLALVGQEYVWHQVYTQRYGLNSTELLKSYFAGAAFLPWQRAGNLNGWNAPLTLNWLAAQRDLQQSILGRMNAWGMTPVIPAFDGHVPRALSIARPMAHIVTLDAWNNFAPTQWLDPSDPLFNAIALDFLQAWKHIYGDMGKSHYYSLEPFHETAPPNSSLTYLHAVATSVYASVHQYDPDAVWVLSSWFLTAEPHFWQSAQIEAFLKAVPIHSLLVLDAYAEVNAAWPYTQAFYGHDFVWCLRNNFGGTPILRGNLNSVSTQPVLALRTNPQQLIGFGLTMEGTDQNAIVYDLMMELAWRDSTVDRTETDLVYWLIDWSVRRYGAFKPANVLAWYTLYTSVYNDNQGSDENIGTSMYHLYMHHTWRTRVQQMDATFNDPIFESDVSDLMRRVGDIDTLFGTLISTIAQRPSFDMYLTNESIMLRYKSLISHFTSHSMSSAQFQSKLAMPFKHDKNVHGCDVHQRLECMTVDEIVRGLTARPHQRAYESAVLKNTVSIIVSAVKSGNVSTQHVMYDSNKLYNVWMWLQQMVESVADAQALDTLQFDIQNIATHYLSDLFYAHYLAFCHAYYTKDWEQVRVERLFLLDVISDVDLLLSSTRLEQVQLGAWLSDAYTSGQARNLSLLLAKPDVATDPALVYSQGAMNQITMWGPVNSSLYDTSYKLWSGLVGVYYYGRWHDFLSTVYTNGTSAAGFDTQVWDQHIRESEWTLSQTIGALPHAFSRHGTGDLYKWSQVLLDKYAAIDPI